VAVVAGAEEAHGGRDGGGCVVGGQFENFMVEDVRVGMDVEGFDVQEVLGGEEAVLFVVFVWVCNPLLLGAVEEPHEGAAVAVKHGEKHGARWFVVVDVQLVSDADGFKLVGVGRGGGISQLKELVGGIHGMCVWMMTEKEANFKIFKNGGVFFLKIK
jgi:hypothetical protein